MHRTVGIIGAGPAGIACAIQLRHCGVDFFLVSDGPPGGQLPNAFCIENYPGLKPMPGTVLANRFKKHLARLKISVIDQHIKTIRHNRQKDRFELHSEQDHFGCEYLVLATGTQPRRLAGCEIDGRTFYDCRPLFRVKDRTILIIGSGEAALDSALSLARRNKVTVFVKKKNSGGVAKRLLEQVVGNRRISIVRNSVLTKATSKGSEVELIVAGRRYLGHYLLVNIGRNPNVPQSDLSAGVGKWFICGAARTGRLGQTAMAVGDGISAAMQIFAGKSTCR
ncbi:MAG: NAD(P)/FAD-dependent oxidoreductase [Deltaproteobacteria bacterium]|nr:NAD(P)/FAD-dependent oxidoreductase [Deltaproteobacteria bacterium]